MKRFTLILTIILFAILYICTTEDTYKTDQIVSENIDTKETRNTNTSNSTSKSVQTILSDGSYRVPDDILPGTYNIYATEGYGKIKGTISGELFSAIIGYNNVTDQTNTYSNLILRHGDTFEIMSNCTIVFDPVE